MEDTVKLYSNLDNSLDLKQKQSCLDELQEKAHRSFFGSFLEYSQVDSRRKIIEALKGVGVIVYVEVEENPAGLLVAQDQGVVGSYLDILFVDEVARKKGVGGRMLECYEQVMRKAFKTKIEVVVSPDANIGAFLANRGFEVRKRKKYTQYMCKRYDHGITD